MLGGGVKHIETIIKTQAKRRELGIDIDDFVVISIGELNENKNHEIIVKAIVELNNPHIKYILCGQGALAEHLRKVIRNYDLENQVKLLGYRTDVKELLQMSDLFAFPSKREGLGMAALEAMSAGLPLLTSDIQGINDYSIYGVTGYKENPNDYIGFAKDIEKCINAPSLLYIIGKNNQNTSSEFDKSNTEKVMKKIYSVLREGKLGENRNAGKIT